MMGGPMGAFSALLLAVLIVQVSLAAPPSPTATKRSDENIQFGNQQNKPVSVLDEDALPGAFPSSETTENEEPEKPEAGAEGIDEETHHNKRGEEEDEEEEDRQVTLPEVPSIEGRHLTPVSQHLAHHQYPQRREEMIRDLPPVALASRWRLPSEFYDPQDWAMPMSPLYGAVEEGAFPSRRRRRSAEHTVPTPDPRKLIPVSLHALRTGHRHKREVHDIRRMRRDLSNIDLDKLRREVDVVELLTMLAKPQQHHNSGYATVTYAPLAPAPPRFAPQPKLFPDYEEEEEEDDDEDDGRSMGGMLRQNVRPPAVSSRVMMPSEDRIWRRSGGYSLSAMPGFKRSSFRANTPPAPPVRALNPGDVYSLAAMLGAELDPVTHRLRRAAM